MGRLGTNEVDHSCPPDRLILAGSCFFVVPRDTGCGMSRVKDMHESTRRSRAKGVPWRVQRADGRERGCS
jgi:hypothetical protein